MIKILRILIGLLGLVVVVAFAVANRMPVAVSLAPLPIVLELPVYGVFLLGLVLGGLLGGIALWLGGARYRWRARRLRNQVGALESQMAVLKKREQTGRRRAMPRSRRASRRRHARRAREAAPGDAITLLVEQPALPVRVSGSSISTNPRGQSMRVIVIGGGIMGLCSAWALRRAGHEPVLYEQGPIPNPLASSCDEHRLTRFTYGAMTGYARMVHAAHAAWDRLWADLGHSHFHPTGTLIVAREDDGWVRASERCLEAMGLPLEIWPPGVLAERLPFLRFAGAHFALFTPTGGVLFAERILTDLARWLSEQGVEVHAGTPVTEVDTDHAAVRTAAGATDRADALVVAAGPGPRGFSRRCAAV